MRRVQDINQRWLAEDRSMSDRQWHAGQAVTMILLLLSPTIPRLNVLLTLPRAAFDTDWRWPAELFLDMQPGFGLGLTASVIGLAVVSGFSTARAPGMVLVVGLIVSNAVLFSLAGKIVHFQWVPYGIAIMSFARWGRDRARWTVSPRFVLAWVVALGFATSAAMKVTGGWLDPSFAAAGQRLTRFSAQPESSDTFNSSLLASQSWLPWELIDIATVGLELGLIFAVFSPVWFRRMLLGVMAFHVGVWLGLGISFAGVLPAYVLLAGPWLPDNASLVRHSTLLVAGVAASLSAMKDYADTSHYLGEFVGLPPTISGGLALIALPSWLLTTKLLRTFRSHRGVSAAAAPKNQKERRRT